MKIVLQRVKRAQVSVKGKVVGAIGPGILLLLGVHANDTAEEAGYLAAKCIELRIFHDENGKMNRSLIDTGGAALIVSQFTLLGDCRKGRRPGFSDAAPPQKGRELYEHFVGVIKKTIPAVQTGIFGEMMDVELVNDGPVTLILEKEHLSLNVKS
jgi:D-tyrosyl-tRNA(Tyr) deacylase